MKRLLFVQMIPSGYLNRGKQQVSHDQVICLKRRFYSIRKNDAEQLEIIEKIRDKLGDHLEVEDRKIFVEEPEVQYTGQTHNIIQFVFKVEFLEDCRQAAIEQMMQEVNMKEMITKGNMQH